MRHSISLVLLFVVGAVPLGAHAQDQPLSEAPAGTNAPEKKKAPKHVLPILPTLRISGDSSGRAELSAGASVQLPLGNWSDLNITPHFTLATTNGIGQLFNVSGANISMGSPWSVGIDAALLEFDRTIKPDFYGDALVEAAAKCPEPTKIDGTDKLCPAGQAVYNRLLEAQIPRERMAATPHLALAVGYRFGQASFRYLEPTAGAPQSLQEASANQWHHAGAISLTWLPYIAFRGGVEKAPPRFQLTVELPLIVAQTWSAASTTAQVCTTVGQVGADPARACADHVVGAPTGAAVLRFTPQIGIADTKSLLWRVAGGPYIAVNLSGPDSGRIELGAQLPLYLNVPAGLSGYQGTYQGLLQMTPRVSWAQTAAGWQDVKFTIQVAVLGKRSMFPRALQWL